MSINAQTGARITHKDAYNKPIDVVPGVPWREFNEVISRLIRERTMTFSDIAKAVGASKEQLHQWRYGLEPAPKRHHDAIRAFMADPVPVSADPVPVPTDPTPPTPPKEEPVQTAPVAPVVTPKTKRLADERLITEAILASKMTSKDVGALFDVTPAAVDNWRYGRNLVSPERWNDVKAFIESALPGVEAQPVIASNKMVLRRWRALFNDPTLQPNEPPASIEKREAASEAKPVIRNEVKTISATFAPLELLEPVTPDVLPSRYAEPTTVGDMLPGTWGWVTASCLIIDPEGKMWMAKASPLICLGLPSLASEREIRVWAENRLKVTKQHGAVAINFDHITTYRWKRLPMPKGDFLPVTISRD